MYVLQVFKLNPNNLEHPRAQYADQPLVVIQIEFKSSRMLGPRLPRRLKPTRPRRKRSSRDSNLRLVNTCCLGDDLQARETAGGHKQCPVATVNGCVATNARSASFIKALTDARFCPAHLSNINFPNIYRFYHEDPTF